MATPEDLESRTEPATQRRRDEARDQGRVTFSAELVGGLLLLSATVLLMFLAQGLGGGLVDAIHEGLAKPLHVSLVSGDAAELLSGEFRRWLSITGVLLGSLLIIGAGSATAQVGFRVAPDKLTMDFSRLAPANPLERVLSTAALVKGGLALLKVLALAFLAWFVLRGRVGLLAAAGDGDAGHLAARGWDLTLRLAMTVAGALFVLGALDYAYQRYRFESALRMTRQEVKEEIKREEGDPAVRARVRQIQRELARRRMMSAVPKASVVVTNPTHVAVALRYERGVTAAPRVLAKGEGFVAERIMAIARQHGIPVVERRPLARALYKLVSVGQEIPRELFYVVAEVLAYVYRLRGIMP
jgi:flagellar biosynthetic protein FlhB